MAQNEVRRSKRRLKSAETVRERAVKAREEAGKTKKQRRKFLRPTTTFIAKPFRTIAKIFSYQPFKFIAVILKFIGRILNRILFLGYLRGSWRELRLVTWPNRKQSRQLTFAVIGFAVVFGAFVSALDYGLDKLFKQVLIK